jgi:hypothetical protein
MANDPDDLPDAAAASPDVQGTVTATFDGPVAEIVLANGPLNLVTRQLLRQFDGILADLARRDGVRCKAVSRRPAQSLSSLRPWR